MIEVVIQVGSTSVQYRNIQSLDFSRDSRANQILDLPLKAEDKPGFTLGGDMFSVSFKLVDDISTLQEHVNYARTIVSKTFREQYATLKIYSGGDLLVELGGFVVGYDISLSKDRPTVLFVSIKFMVSK